MYLVLHRCVASVFWRPWVPNANSVYHLFYFILYGWPCAFRGSWYRTRCEPVCCECLVFPRLCKRYVTTSWCLRSYLSCSCTIVGTARGGTVFVALSLCVQYSLITQKNASCLSRSLWYVTPDVVLRLVCCAASTVHFLLLVDYSSARCMPKESVRTALMFALWAASSCVVLGHSSNSPGVGPCAVRTFCSVAVK